jgi:alpha-glucoside transport system substrate-binding protein
MVWYDTRRYPKPADLSAPARDGSQWCAGLDAEAVSGWPGTDWIEDILLQQQGPAVYEQWAAGKLPWTDRRVAQAWRAWGDLFAGPGVARKVLTGHYADVDQGVFGTHPTCTVEHGTSFTRLYHPDAMDRDGFVFSAALLPGADRRSTAREISGDYAAMFHRTPQSQRLTAYLVSAQAQGVWAREGKSDGGMVFPANQDVPEADQTNDQVTRRIAEALRDPPGALCADASDAMPPRMRIDFQRAVVQFLSHPTQSPRPLLEQLDAVRAQIPPGYWVPHACSG